MRARVNPPALGARFPGCTVHILAQLAPPAPELERVLTMAPRPCICLVSGVLTPAPCAVWPLHGGDSGDCFHARCSLRATRC